MLIDPASASVPDLPARPDGYVMFLALTRPDALAAGGLGGGELLVVVTTGFAIIP